MSSNMDEECENDEENQLAKRTTELTKECSSQEVRGARGKIEIQQSSENEVATEVEDFVREVIEAVAYTMDYEKAKTKRKRRVTFDETVLPVSGKSDEENTAFKRRRRRRRAATAEEMAAREEKMQARRQAVIQRLKEREFLAAEKKRKKEEARKEKEKLKREWLEAKERKRKEEEERRERKKKDEEERKERKRAEEELRRQKRQKEEEERERKRQEEEEKREKKRKEEEEKRERKRKEEEAAELKKKRESDRFLAFFERKEKQEKVNEPTKSSAKILDVLPFFCKQGVSLAPESRRGPLPEDIYKNLLQISPPETPYLSSIKPRIKGKIRKNRAKLFQFHDNWRPPYYGTWRKRSSVITARRPFSKDLKILDYEVDSDEEWEVPDGDDCDRSITDDEEEEQDSEESVDNDGFIVQHGYLSEGEGEDEEDRTEHHEDPSQRAARLQAVADEWEHSMEEKPKKFKKPLVPAVFGPYFGDPMTEGCPKEIQIAQAVFFKYPDSDNDSDKDDDGIDDESGTDGTDDSVDDDNSHHAGDAGAGDEVVIIED